MSKITGNRVIFLTCTCRLEVFHLLCNAKIYYTSSEMRGPVLCTELEHACINLLRINAIGFAVTWITDYLTLFSYFNNTMLSLLLLHFTQMVKPACSLDLVTVNDYNKMV